MTIEQKFRALVDEWQRQVRAYGGVTLTNTEYGRKLALESSIHDLTRILDEAAREQSEHADVSERKHLVDALGALIKACDAGKQIPKPGPCGMTIEANIRHTWVNRVEAWAVEEARIVWMEATTGALPHVGPAPSPLRDAAERVVIVPEGQTPLDKNLRHPLLDAFNSGIASRENGSSSPYHGHSVEHCLRAAGWVQKDLRLALDKARADLRAALANEQPKGGDVLGTGEIEPALTAPVDFEPSAEAVKTALRVWWDDDDIIDDPAKANFIIKSLSEMKDALCAALKIDGPRLIAEALKGTK